MVIEMATSISVTKGTRNDLLVLKLREGHPSIESLIRELIVKYKRQRLAEESERFRRRMAQRKLGLKDLVE
jgi:hypothetical protein